MTAHELWVEMHAEIKAGRLRSRMQFFSENPDRIHSVDSHAAEVALCCSAEVALCCFTDFVGVLQGRHYPSLTYRLELTSSAANGVWSQEPLLVWFDSAMERWDGVG